MTNARQAHWEDVYATKGEAEVSWFQETPEASLALIDLVGAGPASRVIDIGGGASRLVDALVAKGFENLTVLDLSDKALAAARARLGERGRRVTWIVADVTDWRPSDTYDVWHDRAAFHFLNTDAERQAYRERLLSALRVGGHAIIGTFAPDGPDRCSGLPVTRHDAASLSAWLGEGFALVDSRPHAHQTPWGSVQKFQFSAFARLA